MTVTTTTPEAKKGMAIADINAIHKKAVELGKLVLKMTAAAGSGHPSTALALSHIVVELMYRRMRYDLRLAYKRLDKVKSDKGYQGTVVVCSVYFLPIAGHIPDRAVIKYIAELRDIELWLAPIAGTRLMVPYRVSLSTPLGQGILQATEFVSLPLTEIPPPSGRKSK